MLRDTRDWGRGALAPGMFGPLSTTNNNNKILLGKDSTTTSGGRFLEGEVRVVRCCRPQVRRTELELRMGEIGLRRLECFGSTPFLKQCGFQTPLLHHHNRLIHIQNCRSRSSSCLARLPYNLSRLYASQGHSLFIACTIRLFHFRHVEYCT